MEAEKFLRKIRKKVEKTFQIDKRLSRSERKRVQKMTRYESGVIRFFEKKLNIVDPVTFLGSYAEIFEHEIYKFGSTEKEITIIDCGANIGLATIYFKFLFPQASIIAFEPDPNIFTALQNNILTFGFEDVICKNEAISDKDQVLNFQMEGGHSGMIVDNGNDQHTVQVKATRLKSLLNEYERIAFLKIDIEGEEANVIPDIAGELKKVDHLFLEYHSFIGSEQKLGELLAIIKEAGLRYYIKESADKADPFISREIFLNMDMLVNIYCYRE